MQGLEIKVSIGKKYVEIKFMELRIWMKESLAVFEIQSPKFEIGSRQ